MNLKVSPLPDLLNVGMQLSSAAVSGGPYPADCLISDGRTGLPAMPWIIQQKDQRTVRIVAAFICIFHL
jgi:hypothetical protein